MDLNFSNELVLSFISLKKSVILRCDGVPRVMLDFLSLFDQEADKEDCDYYPLTLQKNSDELRERMLTFLTKSVKPDSPLRGMINFLNELPLGHYFMIKFGECEDSQALIEDFKILTHHHIQNGVKIKHSINTFDWGDTLKYYDFKMFGHQRKSILSKQKKEDRVCRFCNTRSGAINEFGKYVAFKNRAHAFSEALGNKRVFSNDECDSCNDRFSTGIEVSLVNYLQLFRSLYKLKGKGGTKKVSGENFSLDPELGFNIKYDGKIDETTENIKTKLHMKEGFIPQDIYRCLVKFVLSVLDAEELQFIERTIDWVNSKFKADSLPYISIVQHSAFFSEDPMLVYYKRKSEDAGPYMLGEFHYADFVFVYIIPFCSLDKRSYIVDEEFQAFWNSFNQLRAFHDWKQELFVGMEKIKIVIDLKLNNLKVGQNATLKKATQ